MRALPHVPLRLSVALALAAAAPVAHLRSDQSAGPADRCQPTFVARRDLAPSQPHQPFPHAHAAGDFNSDGYQDVIVGYTEYNSSNRYPIRIFTGGPAGFVDGTSSVISGAIPARYQPRAMTVADFNGDRRPDVYVAAHGIDTVGTGEPNVLLLSTATGLFDASDRLPGRSDFSHAVAAGDIDNDGDADILVGNFPFNAEEKSSYFLINDGTGQFARDTTRLPARELPNSGVGPPGVVALVDLGGDGFVDLVIGDHYQSPSRVYRNDGRGFYYDAAAVTLPETQISGARTLTVDLVASDIDQDGHTDLVMSMVASNYGGRQLQVLRNLGGGTAFADQTATRMSGAYAESSVNAWYTFIRPFDYNHDGADDIIVKSVITGGPSPAAATPYLFLNDGTGHFSPLPAAALGSTQGFPGPFEPVDEGADGDLDLLHLGYTMEVLQQTACSATPPGAPAITSIAPLQRSLAITFTPPTPAVAVANYQYSLDDGLTWRARQPGSAASPLVVTGLTYGTMYSARLRAVNGAGPGGASPSATGTPSAILPAAPTIAAIAAASGQLTVSFTPPPADGGADISNYQYSTDDGATWGTRSPASAVSPLLITDLINGTSYAIRLRAVNAVGSGTPSAAVNVTPVAPSLLPPADLRVVSVAGNLVTVRWTPPVNSLAPTGHVLEGGITTGQVLASLTAGSATTFSFSAPNGAYYIRVHALSGSIRSAASNEVRIFVNVPAPPGTPANLLGLADGATLSLAWMNSAAGGAPTGMILDVAGSIATSLSLPLSETFTFSGVPRGSYTLSVRATNGTGVSGASGAVTLIFPGVCVPPSVPANFTVVRTGRLITVAWDLPAAGGAPANYVLDVSGTFNGSIPVAGRSLSAVAGPGTYTISVAASTRCGTSPATPAQTVSVP